MKNNNFSLRARQRKGIIASVKTFSAIIAALLMAVAASRAQDTAIDVPAAQPPTTVYRAAITEAMLGLLNAFSNSMVLVQPSQLEIDSAKSVNAVAYPHKVLSPELAAQNMRSIDVSRCPDDFRAAWIDLIHASDNFKPAKNAQYQFNALAAGALAFFSHSQKAGDLAAEQAGKVTSGDELLKSFQRLETVIVKYNNTNQ